MAEKIEFALVVDETGAITSMNRIERATKSATNNMSSNFLSLSNVIKGGLVLAIGASILKIKELAGASISLASNLEETQGKFEVVFRGLTEAAEGWATTLQDSYGMAETESKKYLSSLQDLLVPTGLAREEAGKLSMAFAQMAADLGSFGNYETEQVIRDIQSALQGGSETMAKYGVNVKAAKVEQEIFRLGLVKSKDEINDAHKAIAIYSITMREGADAIGDMYRTQASYANQLKFLKANINDLITTIGKSFLPTLTDIVKYVNIWFQANENIIQQDLPKYLTQVGGNITTIINTLDIFWRVLKFDFLAFKVILQSLSLTIVAVSDTIINGPVRAINELIIQMNRLPGIAIPMLSTVGVIEDANTKLQDSTNETIEKMKALFTTPLAGTAILDMFDQSKIKASEFKLKLDELAGLLNGFENPGGSSNETKIEELKKLKEEEREIHLQGIADIYEANVAADEELRQTKLAAWEWEKEYQAKINDEKIAAAEEQALKIKEIQEQLQNSFATGLTDGLMDWIDGTKSAKDAFSDFASSFLKEIAQMIIKQTILNLLQGKDGKGGLFGMISSFIASADGNVFDGGKLVPFANGGVVSSPTVFPMANGAGIMGEAGPEAIMPLKRGADGKLGVSGGSGGSSFIVTNNIQVSSGAGGDEEDKVNLSKQISQAIEIKFKDMVVKEKRYGGLLYGGA
jgi:hypothetical protein